MSLLVLGVSHQSAPVSVLESVVLDAERRRALSTALHGADHIDEVVVLSTCNRMEVYVEAATFHGAVADLTAAISATSGVARGRLREHLYIHYEDRAVEHAFTLSAGLDSMAVGESQILGQLRAALTTAQTQGHVGPVLNVLLQQALRVGKRVHTDTEIDAVSHSLVEAGLAVGTEMFGAVEGSTVLVLGAGGMGALAATTAARQGAAVTVLNRTLERAERLAARVGGRARPLIEGDKALAEADIVIASTGAVGRAVTLRRAADAQVLRGGRPQLYVDLALPHDVDFDVSKLTGVRRLGLQELGASLADTATAPAIEEARLIVAAEVTEFLAARAGDAVGPTVAALRDQAAEVVRGELERLHRRTPALTDLERIEIDKAVHRIVGKLLHAPTKRVKELAGEGAGVAYAAALSDLFDLPGSARGPGQGFGHGFTTMAVDLPDPLPRDDEARSDRPGEAFQ